MHQMAVWWKWGLDHLPGSVRVEFGLHLFEIALSFSVALAALATFLALLVSGGARGGALL